MPSVNETLQDRSIRHLIHLMRLQNGEAKAIIKMLDNEVIPDLVDKIAAAVSRMELSGGVIKGIEAQRLQRLSGAITDILERFEGTGNGTVRTRLLERLVEVADAEAAWESRLMKDTLPIEWDTATPSINTLRSLVKNQPFDGATLDEWFSNLSANAKNKINQAVRIGVVEGQTMDQIMRRIRGTRAANYTDGILHKDFRRHAEAITRTSVIHSSAMARNEFFQANDDLVKAVQWVATLDTRTCEVCMGLDGQEFEVNGRQPPAHIQCRCVLVPVVKSWQELGIDLDEAPPGTRASMNGQVPAKTTYPEWLKRQSPAVQKDVLGEAKWKLWNQGKIKVSDFTNDTGRILSVDELRTIAGVPKQALAADSAPDDIVELFDVGKFTPAKNKKAAERYLEGLGARTANHHGFPVDMANDFNRGIHWAVQRFGRIADDVDISGSRSKSFLGVYRQKGFLRNNGTVDIDTNTKLQFATYGAKKAEVRDLWERILEHNTNIGFFHENASISSIGAHEMTHYFVGEITRLAQGRIFDSATGYSKWKSLWNRASTEKILIDRTLEALGKSRDYLDEIYGTLGEYSKKNAHETVAVAVQYEFDNPGKLDFSMEMIKQLREMLDAYR